MKERYVAWTGDEQKGYPIGALVRVSLIEEWAVILSEPILYQGTMLFRQKVWLTESSRARTIDTRWLEASSSWMTRTKGGQRA